jgi:hypothetical protein
MVRFFPARIHCSRNVAATAAGLVLWWRGTHGKGTLRKYPFWRVPNTAYPKGHFPFWLVATAFGLFFNVGRYLRYPFSTSMWDMNWLTAAKAYVFSVGCSMSAFRQHQQKRPWEYVAWDNPRMHYCSVGAFHCAFRCLHQPTSHALAFHDRYIPLGLWLTG